MTTHPNGTENALVPLASSPGWSSPHNLQEALQIAELAAKSCLFPGVQTTAAALMKILCGSEMGFGPFASLSDVHIIEGKASVGAHLRAAAIKSSGRYDYRVLECSRQRCELEFVERGRAVGKVAVTLQECIESGAALAKDGKLRASWHRHPDDMLFARAISKGYRRFCPDLSGGVLAYSPEELDSSDESAQQAAPPPSGPVIDVTPEPAVSPSPPPLTLAQLAQEHRRSPTEVSCMCAAVGAMDLAHLSEKGDAQTIERMRALIIQGQADAKLADALNEVCQQLGMSPELRLQRLQQRYGVTSFAHLTHPQAQQLLQTLRKSLASKQPQPSPG